MQSTEHNYMNYGTRVLSHRVKKFLNINSHARKLTVITREVQLAVEMQLQFQNQVKKKRFKKYMPCAYLYT